MEARTGRGDGSLQRFLGTPVEKLVLNSNGAICPEYVMDQLLRTASEAGETVPAYRQLLEEKGLDPGNLQLAQIPVVTKENYFRKYPIPDRCWNGDISCIDFVHCSSGSSGRPQLWTRNSADELTVTGTFELVFHDSFEAHKKKTLVVVCFPLGSWVGGIFTTKCLSYLALKGYKLCIVTPGNKPDDIILLVKELSPLFDQVVLAGYPPFLKGVVDKGISQDVHWGEFRTKLLLAGEVFSEEWRTLMGKRCGMKNPCKDIVSMYGTADAGVIAVETHLSSVIRKWLSEHPEVALELFGRERLPTLCQYSPENKLIEHNPEDLTIVVSTLGETHGASPLLRYGIGDAGGFLSYQQMLTTLERKGLDIPDDILRRVQPFLWVFGRSFWVVSVYGANVYVENIMVGLEQPEMGSFTTGKFVLFVEEDKDLNPRIGLHIELVPGKEPSTALRDQLAVSVTQQLLRLNSEYANYVPADFQTPKVYLHVFGTPEYFPIGVKHSYMMK